MVPFSFLYLFRTVTPLLALCTLLIQKITLDEIKHFKNRCCTINLSQVVSGWLQAPRSTKSFVFTICSISQSNNLYLFILIRWSTLEQTLNLKYAWIFPCQVFFFFFFKSHLNLYSQTEYTIIFLENTYSLFYVYISYVKGNLFWH